MEINLKVARRSYSEEFNTECREFDGKDVEIDVLSRIVVNTEYHIFFDGKKIGTVEMEYEGPKDFTNTPYINWISINNAFQNQGIGTYVLKYLAQAHGSIFLAPDNEDAQRLYQRLGHKLGYYLDGEEIDGLDQGYGLYIIPREYGKTIINGKLGYNQ